MSVTLKDIANRVGKSVPTVSRALAGFEDISPKTRQEVKRIAQEMGYEPNISARNLQRQRTDTLSLILPTTNNLRFSDPFFSEFLAGILEETTEHGYTLNVSNSKSDNPEAEYLQQIRSRRVDGFIVVRTQRQDPRITLLQKHKVPFVAFGRVEGNNNFHCVDDDDSDGIRQVVDHLVSLGHTRLGYIGEPMHFTKAYNRFLGFQAGLQAHNLPLDPTLIIESNFRQRSGQIAARQLLELDQPPTAIVASNDLLALGAMNEIQEHGLTVGQDVSVTGFDDILLAEYASPALTTVHQSAHQLGMMVANLLLKVIDNKPVEQKQIITKPSLIIRQSTGPMKRTS